MNEDRHRRVRRVAAAAAVVCAMGVGALTGAGSASAADDALWVHAVENTLTLPTGVTDPAGARQLHLQVTHDNDGDLPAATVTVDTSGLAGVADVVWPKGCTHSGAIGTCTAQVNDPSGESDPDTYLAIGLSAAAGAASGAHGEVTFTAADGDLKAPEDSAEISVGSGADLVIEPLASAKDVKVGSTVSRTIRWANIGNETTQQTVLTLHTMVGVDFTERYSNCVYGTPSKGSKDMTTVCTIDEPLAPGEGLELSPDLKLKVNSEAWESSVLVGVMPTGAEANALRKSATGKAGDGPVLTAKRVPAAGKVKPLTTEINEQDNTTAFSIKADNHAHYYAVGAQAEGDKGATVPVTVGLGNEGPATIFDMSGGDGVDFVKVTLPKGTTVTKIPAGCRVEWQVGTEAHGPFECKGDLAQAAGYKKTFTFQVRLDEQLDNARGTAALTNEMSEIGGGPVTFPWDDSTEGYTQPIVFNGPTPATNAPGTDDESTTQLAATGASGTTPLVAGAAALLLAAGGAVAFASRRRASAQR